MIVLSIVLGTSHERSERITGQGSLDLGSGSKELGWSAKSESRWVMLQVFGAVLILIAGVISTFMQGVDSMKLGVAAVIFLPFVAGLALVWLSRKAGSIALGALGLMLVVLMGTSSTLSEMDTAEEIISLAVLAIGALFTIVGAFSTLNASDRKS